MSIATLHKTPTKQESIPKNWGTYTPDDMIAAWETGYKKGQSAVQKVIIEKFQDNLNKATHLSEVLYNYLKTNKIKCDSILLKARSPFAFEAAITVAEKDYLSKRFTLAYDKAYEINEKNNSDTFDICFFFIPKTSNLNPQLMIADGYSYFYAPKAKKQTS